MTALLACMLGLAANIASATEAIVDVQGFESPSFAPGALEGQGSWQRTGGSLSTATVQTSIDHGGQELRVDRSAHSDDYWAVPVVGFPNERYVSISWDMRVDQATGSGFGPFFGITAWDYPGTSPYPMLGSLGVDAKTGEVLFQLPGGNLNLSGTYVQMGSWDRFNLLIDYQTETYRGFVDGAWLFEVGFVNETVGGNALTDVDITTFATSGDAFSQAMTGTAYFDNFTVTDGIPGDFDADADVDADDLAVWQAAFNATAAGDADGDGQTTGSDFLIWQRQYGLDLKTPPPALAIPEPSTALLALAGLATVARAARRRMGGRG